MASELRNVLNSIYVEKETKIIPENIKKGIKIFDIEGEYQEVPFDVHNKVVEDNNYKTDLLYEAMTLANTLNGEEIYNE